MYFKVPDIDEDCNLEIYYSEWQLGHQPATVLTPCSLLPSSWHSRTAQWHAWRALCLINASIVHVDLSVLLLLLGAREHLRSKQAAPSAEQADRGR